jgi:putative pyruvate formate lyase activating enzyme
MKFINELSDCANCPRECHADRVIGKLGYCKSSAAFSIASICLHKGEEPVIRGENGICNVFFTHCNLQCTFCQNYQVSRNEEKSVAYEMTLTDVVQSIVKILDTGCNLLGFVSPSHFIPQMKAIIYALHEQGRSPVVIYNSNGYDKVETIKSLEGLIDVYLPDFKYSDAKLSKELSDASDYPVIARKAIKEMVRQKGISLRLNNDGQAESGVIIRHLVLPGYIENSKEVLRLIADEISPLIHISLMSQYYPTPAVMNHPRIGSFITEKEYSEVIEEMELLGFSRGWIQEYSSAEHYCPDFFKEHPFE